MPSLVPPEMIHCTAQVVVYFITVVAGVVSLLWMARG